MSQPGPQSNAALVLIQGMVVHKTSNALRITFSDGPGEPCAVGVQGAGDGKGKKFATLLGFKNGGPGKHVLTFADQSTLQIESREQQPTIITNPDGTEFATVHRGGTSSAVRAGGGEILRFSSDPEEARTPDLFRALVSDAGGNELGRLDIVRKVPGWTLARAVDAAWQTYVWWDHAGQALPVPILGTRYLGRGPLTEEQRRTLLCACVDIAVGLRPYITEMN